MALEAQNNPYPSILMRETVDPSNPAAGDQRLFVDTDHILKMVDSSGTVTTFTGGTPTTIANDTIWDAAGDLVQGSGANTGAKLTAGTAGQYLRSAGAAAANTWTFPPGHEFDYVPYTSPVTLSATTEATANTIVTANSVTYDGNTVVLVSIYMPYLAAIASQVRDTLLVLFDAVGGGAAAAIGLIGLYSYPSSASNQRVPDVFGQYRFTPSAAAHVLSLRGYVSASGSSSAGAGAGGSGAHMPGFIRQVKAT